MKEATSLSVSSSANPALTGKWVTLTAMLAGDGAAAASGMVTFSDGSNTLGAAPLNGEWRGFTDGAFFVSREPFDHGELCRRWAGFRQQFAALVQVVNLRSSATTLTASHTDASNQQAVTLIAVVQASGPKAASDTVSFSAGSLEIGTASIDSNGVATLAILLDETSTVENIIAQYSGDVIYAGSSSAATAVQAGAATQFTLSIDPETVSVATTQHTAVTLTLQSIAGFNDTLQLGCLGCRLRPRARSQRHKRSCLRMEARMYS